MVRVVKISDGLGNQMFQYAFAKKLSLIRKGHVYLDIRFINNEDRITRGENSRYLQENDKRTLGLKHFRITLPIADNQILSRWNYINSKNPLAKSTFWLSQQGMWFSHYRDENRVKKDCVWNYGVPFSTYFQGYYFNLKYYDDIKPVLQREFRLNKPMDISAGLRKVLQKENTVSIHIRRGDFVRLSQDISDSSYYSRAIKHINGRIISPVFLIFSDDIEWVKENINIEGNKIYMSDMGFDDYEELTLMKHCKNHIIANSTFGYWAAYLNPNLDKIVCYPRTWEKREIIPDNWIGI